jgi:hypothetical protein
MRTWIWILVLFILVCTVAAGGYVLLQRSVRVDTPPPERLEYLLLPPFTPAAAGIPGIPYVVHMTYHQLDRIPPKVYANLREFAPEYTLQLYDDARGIDVLRTHFHPMVLEAFQRMKKGAHKADLLRYCLLYLFGGVYLDVKTKLIHPLREVFHDPARKEVSLYLVYDYCATGVLCVPHIYNGILATIPRNPFFLQLIHNVVRTQVIRYYHMFIRQCYVVLERELDEPVQVGVILRGRQNRVYLFRQDCVRRADACPDGLDRYGRCCHVYDQDRAIFQVRYSDFPW